MWRSETRSPPRSRFRDRTRSIRTRPLLWFFGLAYAISWALWFPAVVASFSWIGPIPSRDLHLAGSLGPMLAAMIVTSLKEGQPGLTRLVKRGAAGGPSDVRGHRVFQPSRHRPSGMFLINERPVIDSTQSVMGLD